MKCPFTIALIIIVCNLASASAFSYQEEHAERQAYLSGAAYCSSETILNWSCGEACANATSFRPFGTIKDPLKETQGFVGYDAETEALALVFRGTCPKYFQNWMDDFTFSKLTSWCDAENEALCGRVHDGFATSFRRLLPYVRNMLEEAAVKYNTRRLRITGHSLGGALATLFSANFSSESLSPNSPSPFEVQSVFTFGSPRVGDAVFAKHFSGLEIPEAFRVTHWRDPIIHLPPSYIGFHHVGREIFYDEDMGAFLECDGSGEDPHCSADFLPDSIADHRSYVGIPISLFCDCEE